jgi:hypothetical protein
MVKSPPALALALVAALAPGCRKNTPAAPARVEQPSPAQAAAPPAARPDAAALPPDYDPTVLADQGKDPLQIYLAEPRSATWAAVVEEAIGGQLRRDLKQMVPEAKGLSMGCRTLSCLILVDVPKEQLAAASQVLGLVTLGPITVDLGLSPEGRAQVLVLTERRMADPAEFTGWYRRTRKKLLDEIRAGTRPNSLPVTSDKLPQD